MTAIASFLAAAGALLAGIPALKSYAGIAVALGELEPAVEALVGLVKKVLTQDQPTPADWDALHALEAPLRANLNAPMEGE